MAHETSSVGNPRKFAIVLGVLQVIFIILFAVFADYHPDAKPRDTRPLSYDSQGRPIAPTSTPAWNPQYPTHNYYAMFQDVHVMMFVGFGFLMTFLKRYGFSSLALNFLLTAFVIQWGTLMRGFMHMHDWKFSIDMTTLLTSDFTSAVILITFGAVLGKLSPLQYLVMALIEVTIFTVNEHIGVSTLGALDVGGSIFVHVFGAYFGLAVSRIQYRWEYAAAGFNTLKFTTKSSDLFSMVGTIFLFMFWPSFNSAMAAEEMQQRAIINTYFCLASCCVVTFILSVFLHGKISMELVQNATLAGGVAIGSTADMVVHPYGALIIGAGAAILSCVGFHFGGKALEKIKIYDTCGVNNLHGMPGILAALISVVVCATATESLYGTSLVTQFPSLESKVGRTALMQGLFQLAALGMTLGMALVSGVITGFIIKLNIFDPLPGGAMFDDDAYFALPESVTIDEETAIRNRLGGKISGGYEYGHGGAVGVQLTGRADANDL